MQILVTGATGFIGSNLARRLSKEGYDVRILRRPSSSSELISNIKLTEALGDITNAEDVRRAVKGCNVVFHVAAIVAYLDKFNKVQYDVNVNGTRHIVEACMDFKVRRLIHTSSIVAVGIPKKGEIADERTEYNLWPLNINYCDTKYMAELEVQKGVKKGLDAVIVNPGAVFGPGDIRRFRGHLFGGSVWNRLFYVGGGIATVDVDNVVEGHIRAWQAGRAGERYILANENLSFREIGETIAKTLGRPPPKIYVPTPAVFLLAYLASAYSVLTGTTPVATIPMARFTKHSLFFSNEKARRELGINFMPFQESIERAVAWYHEHGLL